MRNWRSTREAEQVLPIGAGLQPIGISVYMLQVPVENHFWRHGLRGPAAILFISRDTCSDSIAKLFCACFLWGIAQLSHDTLQKGVSHGCACVKLSTKGGYRTILGEC